MGLDGADGDDRRLGDLAVRLAGGDATQHLKLAAVERLDERRRMKDGGRRAERSVVGRLSSGKAWQPSVVASSKKAYQVGVPTAIALAWPSRPSRAPPSTGRVLRATTVPFHER